MEIKKVGDAIAYLRKRAGYTQKDLADRIGISDKAVSKWERGLGLPDVSYLAKLSILLDTDTDSLLAGDVIHHDKSWRGLLMLEENQYGIGASTIIYDKPLVYYLLSYFLLVGVRDIVIGCTQSDKDFLLQEFRDGSKLGIRLAYFVDDSDDELRRIENTNVMVVFGRSIIYGVDQTRFFQSAMKDKEHLTILTLPRKATSARRIHFDENKKIIEQNNAKQVRTQYEYFDIPVLFCPASAIKPGNCGLNIQTTISNYAEDNDVYTVVLDRGYVEFSIDNWDDVADASKFVQIVQKACGMHIYCIEEVAWRRGMISLDALRTFGIQKSDTEYGKYLLSLSE